MAFGVSGGLALLWVATGHDRELVRLGDPRRPHRTRPELVHPSVQMSVRGAVSDAVLEGLSQSSALQGTTSSGPDADLRAPAVPPEATVATAFSGRTVAALDQLATEAVSSRTSRPRSGKFEVRQVRRSRFGG